MVSAGDGADSISALQREAQPLRQSLCRYFARRLRDASDVEDLVQEVFVRVVARDSTTPIGHLGKYLYQTAASVLADYSRRRTARRSELHVAFNPDLHGDVDLDAERILLGREDLSAAASSLLSLPERTRTIFVLRRLEKMPSREVAGQLGISISAVEKHMVRAVQHLTRTLGGTS
jgi:RNA polymerase sigma factor (sigma-70 family)